MKKRAGIIAIIVAAVLIIGVVFVVNHFVENPISQSIADKGTDGENNAENKDGINTEAKDAVETSISPEAEKKVVRVGFPEQKGLTVTDKNGMRSGYTYEYLMEIAQYTGWEYEFINPEGESLDEELMSMLDMLDKGELDIVGSMRKNDELEEVYSYPGYHYGTSSVTLVALGSNTELTPQNYYYKDNLRIAVLKNAQRQIELLNDFCNANNILPEFVYIESDEEQTEVLKEGKADLIVGWDLSTPEETKVIAKFAPEPFFFASTKGNTELINQLDSALLHIENRNPNFPTTIYNRYFSSPNHSTLDLLREEKEYIDKLDTLNVGILPDSAPIQAYDFDTKEASGIMVDILERIAKDTGLRLRYSSAETIDEFEEMAKAGEFDILAGITYDYDRANNHKVIMTQPILEIPYVRIESSVEAVNNNLYGLPKRMESSSDVFDEKGKTIVFYQSSEELLEAVDRGEIRAAYMDSYTAQKLIRDSNHQTLSRLAVPGAMAKVSFGINKQNDNKLLSVISKGVRAMPEEELFAMAYENTLQVYPMTLQRFIGLYPLETMVGTVGFVLVVITVLVLYLKRMTRLKNQLAANNRKYMQLCELVGEVICEYDYIKDILTVSGTNSPSIFLKNVYENFFKIQEEYTLNCVEGMLLELVKESTTGNTCRPCTLPSGEIRWLNVTSKRGEDSYGNSEYLICKISDVDDTMSEMEKLADKAQRDALTGLYNMDAFKSLIYDSLTKTELLKQTGGVFIVLDIDYFKNINDRFGHFEGDQVLKRIAEVLITSFRSTDVIGRLGGDEFVVFSPNIIATEAIVEKCKNVLEGCARISDKVTITVSMGVVRFQKFTSFDQLYKKADINLYIVKKKGRNGFEISTDEGENM